MLVKLFKIGVIAMIFSQASFVLDPENQFYLTPEERAKFIEYINKQKSKKNEEIEDFKELEYGKKSKLLTNFTFGSIEANLLTLLFYNISGLADPNTSKFILKYLNHIKKDIKISHIKMNIRLHEINFFGIFKQFNPIDKEELDLAISLFKTLRAQFDKELVKKFKKLSRESLKQYNSHIQFNQNKINLIENRKIEPIESVLQVEQNVEEDLKKIQYQKEIQEYEIAVKFWTEVAKITNEFFTERWNLCIEDHDSLNFLMVDQEGKKISNFKNLITYQYELELSLLDMMKKTFLEYKENLEQKDKITPDSHLITFILATTIFNSIRICENREQMFLKIINKFNFGQSFDREYSVLWIKKIFLNACAKMCKQLHKYVNGNLAARSMYTSGQHYTYNMEKMLQFSTEHVIIEEMEKIKFNNMEDETIYKWHLVCMHIVQQELENKEKFIEILKLTYSYVEFYKTGFLEKLLKKINNLYIDRFYEDWVSMINDLAVKSQDNSVKR